MASKSKPKSTSGKRDPNTLVVEAKQNEDKAISLARTTLRPSVKGAITIKEYSKNYGDLDLKGLVDELSDQANAVNDGDLKRAEGMLMVQAHTLDAIFNSLALRAINSEYMDNLDRYLRLAMKAQNQSRMTLEALATIKNPPVVYAKQANIAHGHQQVNNSVPTSARDEKTIQSNELLGDMQNEQRLDIGATNTTSRVDQKMETVGAVNRAKNR